MRPIENNYDECMFAWHQDVIFNKSYFDEHLHRVTWNCQLTIHLNERNLR